MLKHYQINNPELSLLNPFMFLQYEITFEVLRHGIILLTQKGSSLL